MKFLNLCLFSAVKKRNAFNHNSLKVKQIKTRFSVIGFFFFILQADAQVKISGKILNTAKKPLEFVEVVLLNKDSIGVKSEIANEDGSFRLSAQQGTYTILIRQFSKVFFSKLIECQSDIDLGEIIVDNASHELNEISVEVKDKLI